MTAPPIPCVWIEADRAFHPLPNFARVASANYGDGEVVPLVRHEERSGKSHGHLFAWLHDAWQSLPEHLTDQFPTEDHLRRWALVKAGFYTEQVIDAGSNAAALRVAAFARGEDEFAAVVVRGPLVVVRKPKSQSRRSMDKAEFAASKTAVLNTIAEVLGVEPEALSQARAA